MGFIYTLLRAGRPALAFLRGESLGSRSRDLTAWALALFAGALLIASGSAAALLALTLWAASSVLALLRSAGAPLALLLAAIWLARRAAVRVRRPALNTRSAELERTQDMPSPNRASAVPCLREDTPSPDRAPALPALREDVEAPEPDKDPRPALPERPLAGADPAEPNCPRCGGSALDEHAEAWVETRIALIDERGDTGPVELDLSHVHYRAAGCRFVCAGAGCGFETDAVLALVPGHPLHVAARAAAAQRQPAPAGS